MVDRPAPYEVQGRDPAEAPEKGASPQGARPVSPLKQTMIGVAMPSSPTASKPEARSRTSAATKQGNDDSADLPATPAVPPSRNATADLPAVAKLDLPARVDPTRRQADLPQVSRGKPPPPVRAPQTMDSELPAVLGGRPKPPAPKRPEVPTRGVQPHAAPGQPVPPARLADDLELPELVKEPPLVKPASWRARSMDSDLPASSQSPSHLGASRPMEFDIDLTLPAVHDEHGAEGSGSSVKDDLEIELPSPFSALDEPHSGSPRTDLNFELDLPSPSTAPLPATGRKDLPSASPARLPAIGRKDLPSVSPARLPASASDAPPPSAPSNLGFGEVDFLGRPQIGAESDDLGVAAALESSHSSRIPDLERTSASGETHGLSVDSLPLGLSAATAGVASPGAPQVRSDFGSVKVGIAESDGNIPVDVGTVNSTGALARQSGGGGTDFGEVSLDAGSNADNVITMIDESSDRGERTGATDLEFGGIPQQPAARAGVRAEAGETAAAKAISGQRKSVVRASRRMSRTSRTILLGSVITLVVGGASLALVPDVGLFGSSYISDRLRKAEYDRLLVDQSTAVQRALANDLYPEATKAFATLESNQKANPRVRSLKAYLAFVAYAIDLRFGPAPERNSKAKVLLDQISAKKDVTGLELAHAARAAHERNLTRAHQKVDDIRRSEPNRVEIRVLSAQIEMLDRRPGQALVYWREVEAAEHSARSAYGSATAEQALGQIDASEQSAKTAIARQPRHVGARLLLARIAMDKRGDEQFAEKIISEALERLADASPAEQVAMQAMLGDLNLVRSRISAAEEAYSKALASDPRCSAALRGLGETLYRAGRFSEALARFEAAVQADPDDTTAAVGVGKTQLSLERVREAATLLSKLLTTHAQSFLVNYWYGAALEANGNRDEAEKAFSAAVKLGGTEPGAIDAYVSLALLKNQQGRREEAQKLLDAARAKLPLSPKLLVAVGQLAMSEGRYEAAISDFRQALQLDSTDIAARFRLGMALRKNRMFDEAMSQFETVAKVDAEFPGLALERGLLYETSGRSEEALKAFEDALAKAPTDPDLMLRVGCGKVAAGRPKEAEALLRKVLEQRPMSAETHHCLGRAQLLESTNLALALRTLERAVELDPYRPEYYLYVGWAANEAGRIAVAEQALKKALSLDQGLGDAYWQRGVLRFRQGAVKDAVADLTKAIELRPSRNEAHAALAEAYYELGMEVRALEHWRVAVQAQPDNASWHYSYGKLLQAASRDGEARGELEKALNLGTKQDPPPRWTWEAHRLLARSIGMQAAAIPHWQEYLRLSPLDNAYRDEAKQALARLGQPWDG